MKRCKDERKECGDVEVDNNDNKKTFKFTNEEQLKLFELETKLTVFRGAL